MTEIFGNQLDHELAGLQRATDYYTAPAMAAADLLGRPYSLEDLHDGNGVPIKSNDLSQTPLGPFSLYEHNLPYSEVAMQVLTGRLYDRAQAVGLDDEHMIMLSDEVSFEHLRRCEGNENARKRLHDYLGDAQLDQADANLIWRAMTASASMLETGSLLLRYPVMQSIEAAKYTRPLDVMIDSAMAEYISDELARHDSLFDEEHYELHTYDEADRESRDVRQIATSRSGVSKQIVGFKDNVAEITNGQVTIQLVRKQTKIVLPPDLGLRFVIPNRREIAGATLDVQPVAVSCYWRIKPGQ